jgi:carbamoyl-phosphate synthase large subunit
MRDTVTILITSAGRRVELIDCFRSAAMELGLSLRVITTDAKPELSAACRKADAFHRVPLCTDLTYIDRLLSICAEHHVGLVIPTIDPELDPLAASRNRFEAIGVRIAISTSEVIGVARDKLETHRFLSRVGIATPRTELIEDFLRDPAGWSFPVVLKPREGSSSIGVHFAVNLESVRSANIIRPAYVAQPYCSGDEFTVNLYFDQTGLRCAIPHRRLEIRGGEVSKAITARVAALHEIAWALGRALAGRAFGALCFQAIVGPDGPTVIDLNARFGGGYPLAHFAGAKFTRWLLEDLLSRPSTASDCWEEGLAMVRYDSSVFFPAAELTMR